MVDDVERPLASLSVLAIKNGKVTYQQQFGAKWIDPVNSRNTLAPDEKSMYRIASISKLITTLGVLKLVEERKLFLDDDVSAQLGFMLRNPHFPETPITLRMLLTHTSSLRDDGGYYWDAKSNTHLKEVLVPGGRLYGEGKNADAMWAKNAKPGTYFQYANLPWGVIGTLMERATGERFDRLMRRLILDPMQLPGGFHPADFSPAELDNTATLYRKRREIDSKDVWNSAGPWVAQVDDYRTNKPVARALPDYVPGSNGTLFGPQGNCRLSAASLGKVMLMLMNGGMHEGKRILQKKSIDDMLDTQWRHQVAPNGTRNGDTSSDALNAWGLGTQHFLDISGPSRGDRLVAGGGFKASGHYGDAWGLRGMFAFDRKHKNGLIMLIGGPSFDPVKNPGTYSAFYRHEEKIMTALHTRAIRLNPAVEQRKR